MSKGGPVVQSSSALAWSARVEGPDPSLRHFIKY